MKRRRTRRVRSALRTDGRFQRHARRVEAGITSGWLIQTSFAHPRSKRFIDPSHWF